MGMLRATLSPNERIALFDDLSRARDDALQTLFRHIPLFCDVDHVFHELCDTRVMRQYVRTFWPHVANANILG